MKPFFPPVFDATMLHAIRSCQYKASKQYMEHWKPKSESVHLRAGGAFAAGIEAARKAYFVDGAPGLDAEAVGLKALIEHYGDFDCPPDSAKSLERMAGALEFYFDNYPLGADGMEPVELASGAKAIEMSFAHALPIKHPQTGDPLLYAGRMDAVMRFAGGVYPVDEKTTSSLGPSWSRQWEMRSQFTGYAWACQQDGLNVDGVIIRGISILKTKYETQQVVTNRASWEVDRWYEQTLRDIWRFMQAWEEGYYDYNLEGGCTEYGGCGMLQMCKQRDPAPWLPMYFDQKVWDPLTRGLISKDAWEAQWNRPGVMSA